MHVYNLQLCHPALYADRRWSCTAGSPVTAFGAFWECEFKSTPCAEGRGSPAILPNSANYSPSSCSLTRRVFGLSTTIPQARVPGDGPVLPSLIIGVLVAGANVEVVVCSMKVMTLNLAICHSVNIRRRLRRRSRQGCKRERRCRQD